MNPITPTPTIDLLELLLLIIALATLALVGYNLRQGWREADWAIDDRDPTMRRLGVARLVNAVCLLAIVLFLVLMASSALFVTSPINDVGPTPDVTNAITQRVGAISIVLLVAAIAANDAWWRRDSDARRRSASPRPSANTPEGEPA